MGLGGRLALAWGREAPRGKGCSGCMGRLWAYCLQAGWEGSGGHASAEPCMFPTSLDVLSVRRSAWGRRAGRQSWIARHVVARDV